MTKLPELHARILGDSTLRALLERACDFRVGGRPGSGMQVVPEPQRRELMFLARDATGGCFCLWRRTGGLDENPVVYLGTEGDVGRFADSFGQAVQLVAAFQSAWHDVWTQDDLKAMQGAASTAALELEEEAREGDGDALARQKVPAVVEDRLGLARLRNPVRVLHAARTRKPPYSVPETGPGWSVGLGKKRITLSELNKLATKLRKQPRAGLHLSLGGDATDEWLKTIRGSCVDELSLGVSKVTDNGLAVLPSLRGLTGLDLGHTVTSDVGLKHIGGCLDLVKLELSNTSIRDSGIKHLTRLTRLQRLILTRTNVRRGVRYIAALPGLHYLDLYGTKVDDEGLEALRGAPALEELILCETPITDRGLLALHGMKSLRRVNAAYTAVTARAKKSLGRTLARGAQVL